MPNKDKNAELIEPNEQAKLVREKINNIISSVPMQIEQAMEMVKKMKLGGI